MNSVDERVSSAVMERIAEVRRVCKGEGRDEVELKGTLIGMKYSNAAKIRPRATGKQVLDGGYAPVKERW